MKQEKPTLEKILRKIHTKKIETSRDVARETMKIYEYYLLREYNEGFQDGYEQAKKHYGIKKI